MALPYAAYVLAELAKAAPTATDAQKVAILADTIAYAFSHNTADFTNGLANATK
jgi:hypothetical protein